MSRCFQSLNLTIIEVYPMSLYDEAWLDENSQTSFIQVTSTKVDGYIKMMNSNRRY